MASNLASLFLVTSEAFCDQKSKTRKIPTTENLDHHVYKSLTYNMSAQPELDNIRDLTTLQPDRRTSRLSLLAKEDCCCLLPHEL